MTTTNFCKDGLSTWTICLRVISNKVQAAASSSKIGKTSRSKKAPMTTRVWTSAMKMKSKKFSQALTAKDPTIAVNCSWLKKSSPSSESSQPIGQGTIQITSSVLATTPTRCTFRGKTQLSKETLTLLCLSTAKKRTSATFQMAHARKNLTGLLHRAPCFRHLSGRAWPVKIKLWITLPRISKKGALSGQADLLLLQRWAVRNRTC